MIDKQYGSYYAVCDACGTALDGEYDDFQDAVDGMRANGWRTSKTGADWMNYCPACAATVAAPRPGAGEFAGCTCGTCGNGRPVPESDTETRAKIMRYRQTHGT